jgi:serine/threonine protein phosphatase 1
VARVFLIGDIHGCYAELMDLLDRAGLGDHHPILAVGDILDRGPDSRRVLEFFGQRPGSSSVLGNHERAHRRVLRRGGEPVDFCQRATQAQLGPSYRETIAVVATFPRYVELPEAIVAHGFWEPGLAPEQQRERVVTGTAWGESYLAERYDRPWYELYDGAKPLVVGHRDYHGGGQPFVYKGRVLGIDTGCCYGRRLTGLVLPEFRLVSVPSRGDHWAETCARYAGLRGNPGAPADG